MPRFVVNRWWTLILALTLWCASAAVATGVSDAQSRTGGSGDSGLDGNPGFPPTPGAGDPDIPLPSSKVMVPRGGLQPAPASLATRVAGDSTPVESVWMRQFRAILQILRIWGYPRF